MKYKYKFVNEEIEIEVSEEWAEILSEEDVKEYNNDKTETRRHLSLDVNRGNGRWLFAPGMDYALVLCELSEATADLTEKQLDALYEVNICGMHLCDYAKTRGIALSSAFERIDSAKKKMKKYL